LAQQAIHLKVIDLAYKCGTLKVVVCKEKLLYLGQFAIGEGGIKLAHCHNSQKSALASEKQKSDCGKDAQTEQIKAW